MARQMGNSFMRSCARILITVAPMQDRRTKRLRTLFMKTRVALLLSLTQLVPGTSQSQNMPSAKSQTPEIKIAANVPNTTVLELARPHSSRDIRVGGKVVVRVRIDRTGDVTSARAISGHALLRPLAVVAARKSKFKRNSVAGRMNITGTISYVFPSAVVSYSQLRSMIGRQVSVRGKFSMYAKIGPCVLVNGRPVYIVQNGSVGWGQRYARMEGRTVSVTGKLLFHETPPEPEHTAVAVARVPDYFYFEAESASIRLEKQRR